jgi:protein tyrosine phosphatase (PTP) superfamily phosphohydrolase (DUF442 family)
VHRNRLGGVIPSVIASMLLAAGVLGTSSLSGLVDRGAQRPRNFGVVWENKLTRSGMPYNESGWQWLRSGGTKSIITFRPQQDVNYQKFGFERVFRIPLTGLQVPTEEQVNTFLEIIQDPGNWPVHMHCTAGWDRTGMMAALARYAVDGWPLDKALAEAKAYRGEDLTKQRVAWLKSWASTHKPGSYRSSRSLKPEA